MRKPILVIAAALSAIALGSCNPKPLKTSEETIGDAVVEAVQEVEEPSFEEPTVTTQHVTPQGNVTINIYMNPK